MGLKIVRGRTAAEAIRSVRVAAPKVAPVMGARELAFKCDACERITYGRVNWDATREERQALIKEALDEHRKVCTAKDAAAGRKYEIWYPRG